MPTAKEQLRQIGQLALRHLDYVVMGTLGFLLGGLFMIGVSESATPEAQLAPPAPHTLNKAIALDSPAYTGVVYMAERFGPMETSVYRKLLELNMFDARLVLTREELETQAKELTDSARQQFEQGNWTRAQELVGQALQIYPTFPTARALKQAIEARLTQPEPTPAPEAPVEIPLP